VNAAGEIVADTTGGDTAAALAAAREEGRAEGVASVDITTDNQAAFDEGAASVTPLNCAEGTAVNEAGDACEPTAEYRAAAVEEGHQAGVASVTPLNCAEGTAINEAGDACEPNLSVDVTIDDAGAIVPTAAYASMVSLKVLYLFRERAFEYDLADGCFRSGYCTDIATRGWFTAEQGNIYAGDNVENHCGDSAVGRQWWEVGRLVEDLWRGGHWYAGCEHAVVPERELCVAD